MEGLGDVERKELKSDRTDKRVKRETLRGRTCAGSKCTLAEEGGTNGSVSRRHPLRGIPSRKVVYI